MSGLKSVVRSYSTRAETLPVTHGTPLPWPWASGRGMANGQDPPFPPAGTAAQTVSWPAAPAALLSSPGVADPPAAVIWAAVTRWPHASVVPAALGNDFSPVHWRAWLVSPMIPQCSSTS